jgi:hypothetical protein
MLEGRLRILKKKMKVLLALFIELIKIINEDFNLFESRIISILRYIHVFILFLEII